MKGDPMDEYSPQNQEDTAQEVVLTYDPGRQDAVVLT